MLTSRESASLDRYITGNYGEDQFNNESDFDETGSASGHAVAFYTSPQSHVYNYDAANDGPECEAITRILARHTLYTPGKEGELLRFEHFVDRVARHLFGKRYSLLGTERKEKVRAKVVALHLGEDFKGKAYWTLGRLWA
jgi:hypothetical protein